ncbi:MAG: sigma 54-interacting transcriptional regulator [Alphaproteobacteria bacterium]|nr:sigma 54-interacting transcriptional regulator [Alphaproteobacteria bacterium]
MAIELLETTTRRRGGRVPQLQILEQDRTVLSYLLRSARTVIGRSDRSDIALPSDTVSRTHCAVERRGDSWWLVDHSRHGTPVDGASVAEVALSPGDAFQVGAYQVRFVDAEVDDGGISMTRMARPADHEELVDVADGVTSCRAELRVIDGPKRGLRTELSRARTRVGGPGAHVQLDGSLPADAAVLRVSRGRVMVEPGARPVFLGGQRVRTITPVLEGENLRLGEHELSVTVRLVEHRDDAADGFGDLVGASPVMRRLYGVLDRVARHDATVLLVGESGTGKELAARALHDGSPRHDRAFVAVNCAAIPEHLVESELFGHEAGAFTGAARRVDGAFQRADGGTLFLDELGELSAGAQAKLLRALESGEVHRVGGQAAEFPDVRVVAATHAHLGRMAEEGRFRRDLLYRLAVLTVTLPPLRKRKEDLPAVARALLARHHPEAALTAAAQAALSAYDWPGNVRELRNVLTRAVVLHGPEIHASHLSFHPWSFDDEEDAGAGWSAEEAERARLVAVLRDVGNNRAAAARELGIARTSLLYKLRKHGLD